MFTLQETYETFTVAADTGTLRRERPPVSALVVLIEDMRPDR